MPRLKKGTEAPRKTWAETELERLEAACEDEDGRNMQHLVTVQVMQLLKVLQKQGHTGFSLGYIMRVFEDCAYHRVLTPLTGEADEWGPEITKGSTLRQNKRQSNVFMEDGKAYFLEGRIFRDEGSQGYYTNGHSRTPVTFPWHPPRKVPHYVVKESCSDFDSDLKCDRQCEHCSNWVQTL